MISEASQCHEPTRYVVVVADDFGSSVSVNEAVAEACDRGFLTAASIMAGSSAFEGAVEVAAKHPALSVGLHVTLSEGSPVLPGADIPDLVDDQGRFDKSPMRAGIKYWKLRDTITGQIEGEVKAQFDKLERTGIRPTHVDCHHHLHMHPLLFAIIAREAAARGVAWIRIPREPRFVLLGPGLPLFNVKAFLTWLVLGILAKRNLKVAHRCGLRAVNNVYGLSGTGKMSENYFLTLLSCMKGEVNEIYLHPDLGSRAGCEETGAVTSWNVRRRLKALGLRPVGFRELTALLPPVGFETDSIANGPR